MAQSAAVLAPSASVTATATGAGVDLSDFTGICKLVLNSTQMAAGQTSDITLEHSDTLGSGYTASGIAFAQQTNALNNGFQTLDINVDNFKKYVRIVNTIAGSATAVVYGVTIVGRKMTNK